MEVKYHEPVLLKKTLDYLQVGSGEKYIDCTLGDGGHTLGILKKGGLVLGLDSDEGSLKRAKQRIEKENLLENLTLIKGNFKDIGKLAGESGFSKVSGILYDLGISSTQLEDNLGLSFSIDQPLDMRLDKDLGVTAGDLVNGMSRKELEEIFRNFGEERYAKRFAKKIVEARRLDEIKTTKELANLIVESSPGYERGRLHPATRVFQALRIAVNDEIESLRRSLPWAARLLLPGGRMIVISFHSLEDKEAKSFGRSARLRMRELVKKPLIPSKEEVVRNPRARSARMRVFEKAYD